MRAICDIVGSEFNLLTSFEAFTQMNEHHLREYPDTPGIYEAGISYIREGSPELWFDIPNIIGRGGDDCEGLAAWRAAEFRLAGYLAWCALRRYTDTLYHCLVEVLLPNGQLVYDDPAARLGMFGPETERLGGTPRELWSPLPNSERRHIEAKAQRGASKPDGSPIDVIRLQSFRWNEGAKRWDFETGVPRYRRTWTGARTPAAFASPDIPPPGPDRPLYGSPDRVLRDPRLQPLGYLDRTGTLVPFKEAA